MLTKIKNYELKNSSIIQIGIALVLTFGIFAITADAQTISENTGANVPPEEISAISPVTVLQPVLTNYKDIKIGMTADDVREKLGKPKTDDENELFYQISGEEFTQIQLDKDKKVQMISTTYTDKHENAPSYKDIFGTDAAEAAKPDGAIHKLVDYPQAGYWVAYSRMAGDKAMVTVTMQKL